MPQPSPRWTTAAELSQVDVPPGGTTDQVLAKNSNADRDLKWADAGGAGGSFLSANTARVDPSGDDGTGTVGDLSKPFLTVQAAVDAIAATVGDEKGVIDVGFNDLGAENITISVGGTYFFVGVSTEMELLGGVASAKGSVAFGALTLTANAVILLKHCTVGEITTNSDLFLYLQDAFTDNIVSTAASGELRVQAYFNSGGGMFSITANSGAEVTVSGLIPYSGGSQITAANTVNIINCKARPDEAEYDSVFSVYQTDTFEITVNANNSLLGDITCVDATFVDSRAQGSITVDNGINYEDVFLKGVPPGGTTGQALEKASNDDFDTVWNDLV